MKMLGNYLVNSKLYIAFAALSLTIATQIQLGGSPQFHPYLFIVFFATFLEYNLTRFIVLVLYQMPLVHPSDQWVNKHRYLFYTTFLIAVVGLVISLLNAKQVVQLSLIPITAITILYTLPFLKLKQLNLNLRKVPFLKIFLIMMVWAFSTIMLPIIQMEHWVDWKATCLLLLERLFFIGALAILFDLRDVALDHKMGLKTIPIILGEKKSILLSNGLLLLFLIDSLIYYWYSSTLFLMPAAFISFFIVLYLINYFKLKMNPHYHAIYLDGAILLHGLIILLFYCSQNI